MTATRLILVRHAEPVAEAGRVVYGRLDFELSEAGLRQADAIAESVSRESVSALYASPLRRAVATADAIGRALCLTPIVVDGLREIDFGMLEGIDRGEAFRLHPGLRGWLAEPRLEFPGGESVATVWRRAVAAIREVVAGHPGETVVAVSHAVPIRSILAEALEMPPAALFRLDQVYGGISVIDWFDGRPLVRSFNRGCRAEVFEPGRRPPRRCETPGV